MAAVGSRSCSLALGLGSNASWLGLGAVLGPLRTSLRSPVRQTAELYVSIKHSHSRLYTKDQFSFYSD